MISGLKETIANARATLLAERNDLGHWEGELSTSALSTATAIVALHQVDAEEYAVQIRRGADWLTMHQNRDGGWGDTVKSFSNISTSLLCWSALCLVKPTARDVLRKAEAWVTNEVGSLDPAAIVKKVTARYGRDKTFAVPILMHCAICGRLGDANAAWRRVLPMPFELAAFPREWFATLRFPVVSYALPALIAIGYAQFYHAPPIKPLRWLRNKFWPKVSLLLSEIQPESGGFLEAAPLTSFVTMALASAGEKKHPAVLNCVEFLVDSAREDGSWPIDTNLATWTTTLATKALLKAPKKNDFSEVDRDQILGWLLAQQYREVHPFTNAAPGGWAWTNLSGGVPDADDTPGTLLAIRQLATSPNDVQIQAAQGGVVWLLDLQNGDGGIPTFCRGWGTLPFDRSSSDLTAHTLRAWHAWRKFMPIEVQRRMERQAQHALNFLKRKQDEDESWTPLWFGNQYISDESNHTYGTAMVSIAMREVESWLPEASPLAEQGQRWLRANQNKDGGWGAELGAPSTLEETSLAIDALQTGEEVEKGIAYLIEATQRGSQFPAEPIGFYFAKLWYFEKLYPMVWVISALEQFSEDSNIRP